MVLHALLETTSTTSTPRHFDTSLFRQPRQHRHACRHGTSPNAPHARSALPCGRLTTPRSPAGRPPMLARRRRALSHRGLPSATGELPLKRAPPRVGRAARRPLRARARSHAAIGHFVRALSRPPRSSPLASPSCGRTHGRCGALIYFALDEPESAAGAAGAKSAVSVLRGPDGGGMRKQRS